MADLEGFERAASAQLAAREARRPARRRGLPGRRPLRRASSAASSAHLRDAHAVRAASRSRKALAGADPVLRDRRDSDREAFDIAWVQNRDSAVDTMNGFIEVYMDARGMKGAWEGVVYYINHEKTDEDPRAGRARAVVRGSPAGRSAYRKPHGAGRVGAGHRGGGRSRRLGTDHADRRQPAERSAHPREVRQQVGVAVERARRLRAVDCPTASARSLPGTTAEVERAKRWGAFASELTTEIHEVLGHGSGRMADHIDGARRRIC